jgi:hypothetical protein
MLHLVCWLFRHKRLMELDELSGRTTGLLRHTWPTTADWSLRHRRDGNAGTTILYHLRNRRRPHSSSVMTAGRRELFEHGQSRRILQSRSSFRGTTDRTEQLAD